MVILSEEPFLEEGLQRYKQDQKQGKQKSRKAVPVGYQASLQLGQASRGSSPWLTARRQPRQRKGRAGSARATAQISAAKTSWDGP